MANRDNAPRLLDYRTPDPRTRPESVGRWLLTGAAIAIVLLTWVAIVVFG